MVSFPLKNAHFLPLHTTPRSKMLLKFCVPKFKTQTNDLCKTISLWPTV